MNRCREVLLFCSFEYDTPQSGSKKWDQACQWVVLPQHRAREMGAFSSSLRFVSTAYGIHAAPRDFYLTRSLDSFDAFYLIKLMGNHTQEGNLPFGDHTLAARHCAIRSVRQSDIENRIEPGLSRRDSTYHLSTDAKCRWLLTAT